MVLGASSLKHVIETNSGKVFAGLLINISAVPLVASAVSLAILMQACVENLYIIFLLVGYAYFS